MHFVIALVNSEGGDFEGAIFYSCEGKGGGWGGGGGGKRERSIS